MLIVLAHGLIIELMLRRGKEVEYIKATASRPLLIYFLAPTRPSVSDAPKGDTLPKAARKSRVDGTRPAAGLTQVPEGSPSNGAAPAVPPIDWQAELELVARNNKSDVDENYRDLSKSLSIPQLNWLRDHHMEPANPGIVWKKPRVEITENGLPIVHINDHCVLVPIFLVPMIFCGIGHIEPNGDLFKHMREPQPH